MGLFFRTLQVIFRYVPWPTSIFQAPQNQKHLNIMTYCDHGNHEINQINDKQIE